MTCVAGYLAALVICVRTGPMRVQLRICLAAPSVSAGMNPAANSEKRPQALNFSRWTQGGTRLFAVRNRLQPLLLVGTS